MNGDDSQIWESYSVVIVLQSQVWISKLPIGRMAKIFKFLLKFHIVVVQQQQRNVQNNMKHVQIILWFVKINILFFSILFAVAVVVGFVAILK